MVIYMYIYIYIHIHTYAYAYIYIYIYRERDIASIYLRIHNNMFVSLSSAAGVREMIVGSL